MLGWLIVCFPLHFGSRLLFRRSHVPRLFLRGASWICGARVRTEGAPVGPHTLLIVNHTSWLDILVLAGATGCAFVSKDNLGHGFVHWLADQNYTLYVRREDKRGAAGQANAIAAKLRQPQPIALFPEGTTGPGTHLLPFRSTLFAAVTPVPEGAAIRPVAIDYAPAEEVGWYGESGKDNVLRILGRPGTIPVTLHMLDPLAEHADRKALSKAAHAAIERALSSSRLAATL
ncbi:1-acyl-sn-glycerol-3-phosphate acyltransferase [Sphingomonas sinipercae]|uniref:1-acyl-sn-glycerol-3-phosphate acyltransferase n=1 Tax=Sphingomonas sinipercae TaxID=2714944 RepID=A0A6G7ZM15_9SPHN|nr:lysophospholipid acyltransferase family protein [Sphingomonas sinipercae]QIL02021.1 1-acyl-sn-glycerol-3-phosphate acyltransferase [Sphingomonas sinipercae]